MGNAEKNFLYGNNTPSDLRDFHAQIKESLLATGTLPEDLADLFVAVPVPGGNADGSPRYMINPA